MKSVMVNKTSFREPREYLSIIDNKSKEDQQLLH